MWIFLCVGGVLCWYGGGFISIDVVRGRVFGCY